MLVKKGVKKKPCGVIAELVGESFRNTFKYHKFLGVHVWEKDAWVATAVRRWYKDKLMGAEED